MLKDVTLGQFFPGESLLHKADPRSKLILTVLYIITLFIANNIFAFLALFIFSIFLIILSKISIKVILDGFKPILFILIFTLLVNILKGLLLSVKIFKLLI